MTAHLLTTELSNLVQESKKKTPDLKTSAENSLRDLKSLPTTSESQLAGDLTRRPNFSTPFLTACKTKNPKLVLPAVSCLQRLVVSGGLSTDRLQEVLEAFQECLGVGLDIQLKILQALPSLLQNYADSLEDELQAIVLQVCTSLQQVKAVAVASTASATLQQAFSFLFEKVEAEDGRSAEVSPAHPISVAGEDIKVHAAARDAFRAFDDVCLMIEGQSPKFIRKASLSTNFGLELIETLLLNHADIFLAHPELSRLLNHRVMPLINRLLSEKSSFSTMVRTMRVFCILLREHLESVESECEIALSVLNHILDSDTATPWRRALCLEAFRLVYSGADLVVNIFSTFDKGEEKRSIIQDNLALFVRLASEKPNLIGVGQQSTIPTTQSLSKVQEQEQAVIEAGNAAGIIGSDFGVSEVNVPGISSQWSSMKVPCLDILDKSDSPNIPETYIYSLVLTCINNLSEVLAKIILPVTLHSHQKQGRRRRESGAQAKSKLPHLEDANVDGTQDSSRPDTPSKHSARSIPPNPAEMHDHPARHAIKITTALVNACWPAVLATSSTFLYAALDADFYRGLVRSIQKFTQVAGLLRLATPRDAFLTVMAKGAVPPSLLKSDSTTTPTSGLTSPEKEFRLPTRSLTSSSAESFLSQGPIDSPNRSRRASVDLSGPCLTQRNLMCLRALVNLAIALGPILDQGWPIVLESIQKANVLLSATGAAATARDYRSTSQTGVPDGALPQPTLSTEIAAVEGAVTRLFQSTSDYPNESFIRLLTALCGLLRETTTTSTTPAFLSTPTKSQRRVPSVSGISTSSNAPPPYSHFAIAKLEELTRANLTRFIYDAANGGWELLIGTVIEVSTSSDEDGTARSMAVNVASFATAETTIAATKDVESVRSQVQHRSLSAIEAGIKSLQSKNGAKSPVVVAADLDIHQSFLDALRTILERCGDSIITGWSVIFNIIRSAFIPAPSTSKEENKESENRLEHERIVAQIVSPKLARSAFSSLQLICSDFLSAVPKSSASAMTNLIYQFGSQRRDMNISLTAVTLFWNVSDHLQNQISSFTLPQGSQQEQADEPPHMLLSRHASKGSATAMWMILQQRLAEVTSDPRGDVRNGAIHTIFRTFENCGDQFSSSVWEMSTRTVLFRVIELNVDVSETARSEEDKNTVDLRSLNNSSRIILESTAHLFATYLGSLISLQSFKDIWHDLLQHEVSYIDCESYELSTIAFKSLSSILSSTESSSVLGSQAINEAASLWARGIPSAPSSAENDDSSKDNALVAYIDCAKQIHRLLASEMSPKHTAIMLTRMQECVEVSTAPPYINDIDAMTKLQKEVLECFQMIRQDQEDIPSKMVKSLSHFARLPHSRQPGAKRPQELTFVAFAKAAIDMLQEVTCAHVSEVEIYTDDAASSALSALLESIQMKYLRSRQGKEPSLWRKATSSAVHTISKILPSAGKLELPTEKTHTIWAHIVSIFDAMQGSHRPDNDLDSATLIADEDFDLDALSSLARIVTPYFAQSAIPGPTRRVYLYNLTHASLVHKSRFDPLPSLDPDKDACNLLSNIHDIRLGRTYNPPFDPRLRISYTCINELFRLVSSSDARGNSMPTEAESFHECMRIPLVPATERSKTTTLLASTALPFLIIRCANTLKRYIADQPLRGRMPTPSSQRLEMLYLLEGMKRLRCEEDAVAALEEALRRCKVEDAGGPASSGPLFKIADPTLKHLEFLGPLVNRAVRFARFDWEIEGAMRAVLDLVF